VGNSHGFAGGFMVAGPSKGPDRNRKNNNVEFRSLSLLRFDIRHSIFEIFYQNTGEMHTPVFVKLLLTHRQSRRIYPRISELMAGETPALPVRRTRSGVEKAG
jgi:hypothetical protein